MRKKTDRPSTLPVRIFISHVDDNDPNGDDLEDKGILGKLRLALQEKGPVEFVVNSPQDLLPGDVLEEGRAKSMAEAQIILLFVTTAYLASTAMAKESKEAIEQHEVNGTIVVPVILTTNRWNDAPFSRFSPIAPKEVNNKYLFSDQIVKEIHSKLVELVQARSLNSTEPLPEKIEVTIYRRSGFSSAWVFISALILIVSVGALIHFSGNPTALNTEKPWSPSPSRFFIDSLVIGIAAMSLLQVFRRLIRMRGAFHHERVTQWLGEPATIELIQEVGPSRVKDFFDLPSELLTGQLNAIAERVMERRAKNNASSALIRAMVGIADSDVSPRVGEIEKYKVDAAMAIQVSLDQFQISTSARWKHYLLLTSILLSTGLFVVGLRLFHAGGYIPRLASPPMSWVDRIGNFGILLIATALTGLFGGFLGSIVRDIVAIIERLRR